MGDLSELSSLKAAEVEELLDDAFGVDRHQRTAYLLRHGVGAIDHLSFGIVDNNNLVGSIQCWPVKVASTPLILVGPVAVSHVRQNQGIGHRLMQATLGAIRPNDPPMVMIGDPEYYGRFGFITDDTGGWTLPGPWERRRLLARNPDIVALPWTGMIAPRLADTGL